MRKIKGLRWYMIALAYVLIISCFLALSIV